MSIYRFKLEFPNKKIVKRSKLKSLYYKFLIYFYGPYKERNILNTIRLSKRLNKLQFTHLETQNNIHQLQINISYIKNSKCLKF